MKRPVVICNAYADDNKGGSLITQQTIAWAKREFPGREIWLVPVVQKGDTAGHHRFTLGRYPDVALLPSPFEAGESPLRTAGALLHSLAMLWRRPGADRFERTLADAEIVISKGGYVFVERGSWPGLLGLWFTAFPLLYAGRKGAKTLVLCASVGPFVSRASRLLVGWLLRRVDLVVTRDPISTEQARSLGCSDVLECPDIALTFAVNGTRGSGRDASRPDRYACLVLSAERGRPDAGFLRRLSDLSRRLLDEGVVDRILVVVQSREDGGLGRAFVEDASDRRIALLEGDPSPVELMTVYGSAELVITKRLHGGLFAMLSGTPVLMFSTDGVKSDGVMRRLEMSDRLLPYPDFSLHDAWSRIEEILESPDRERDRIHRNVNRERSAADATLRRIGEAMRRSERKPGRALP